jgi:signal-transduction protein with cAMP-binding, CBS, and nucleotidyltransferase domain
MEQIKHVMRQMINVEEVELNAFLESASTKSFKRQEIIAGPGVVPNEILFINKGIIRVFITDSAGLEHTIHFALENQFIADYSNYILQQPSMYSLQALEETQLVVLPRSAVDWGYQHLREGQKMGRLIAEYYWFFTVLCGLVIEVYRGGSISS